MQHRCHCHTVRLFGFFLAPDNTIEAPLTKQSVPGWLYVMADIRLLVAIALLHTPKTFSL
jgi:hypothetical protein